jgi:hypothetical protein
MRYEKECGWCGAYTSYLELIRGHYSCPVCRKTLLDCCDGEKELEELQPNVVQKVKLI